MRELPTEATVLLGELAALVERGLQPGEERGFGRSLAHWDRRRGLASALAETFDLDAKIDLPIEPRPGDPGALGDALEGDHGSGALELADGLNGFRRVSSLRRFAARMIRRCCQDASEEPPGVSSSAKALMIFSRFLATWRFISTMRVCPLASAAVMISTTCSWCCR